MWHMRSGIYCTAFVLVICLLSGLFSDQIREKRVEQSVKDAFNDQVQCVMTRHPPIVL